MPRIHRDIILRSKAIPLQCLWLNIIFCAVKQGECPPTTGQLYGAHLGEPLIRYSLLTLFSSSNLTHGLILHLSNYYYSLLDCILKDKKKKITLQMSIEIIQLTHIHKETFTSALFSILTVIHLSRHNSCAAPVNKDRL